MSKIDGKHVVTMENGAYKLDVDALQLIMTNEAIQDLPVAFVSVAGAFRGGKSFLLSFFLRYLDASPEARADGSWLENSNNPLNGFSWRGGTDRNTTGILMWPKPFVIETSNGEHVAVFLMDTQGTFDSTSTVRDCSTIFALSTLLASFQIYNIANAIKEDDLQDLELFTDYGKLMNEKEQGGKAFQVLQFLIRDWMNDEEYNYGAVGGDAYLKKTLTVSPLQPIELQNIRKHILSSFEKVTCFLMPHPGLTVGKRKFQGRLSEIEDDFKLALKELTSLIFSPQTLAKKLINGQPVKCRELFQYFKVYMNIFNSDKLPEPKTIFTLTSETGILMAYNEARDQFERNMKLTCGTEAPSLSQLEVVNTHHREVEAATAIFKAKKLMGEKADIDKKLLELTDELNNRQKEYLEINASKTMRAKDRGLKAYDAAIKEVSPLGLEQVCVHAADVQILYEYAFGAAETAFDKDRKVIPGQKDTERDQFIKELKSKLNVLKLTNKQNNLSAASDVKSEYFQAMVLKCNHKPKLSNEDFEKEHQKAYDVAKAKFDASRNENTDILKTTYTFDDYKKNLEQELMLQFGSVKQINQSNNSDAFERALAVIQAAHLSPSEIKGSCLHPNAMTAKNEKAKCDALQAYRQVPVNCYTAKFNKDVKDELLLEGIIKNSFESEVEMNDVANEAAEEKGFQAFKAKFDELSGHWYYLLGIPQGTRLNYLNKARPLGIQAFYKQRRDGNTDHGYDKYKINLKSRCQSYSKVTNEFIEEDRRNRAIIKAIVDQFTGRRPLD